MEIVSIYTGGYTASNEHAIGFVKRLKFYPSVIATEENGLV
jgi:hypothetical protein